MFNTRWFIVFLFILISHLCSAVTYSWGTYIAGALTYSNSNLSSTVTNTSFDTRGPDDPNGGANSGYKNPKYVSAATISAYQAGTTNDYGMPGLVLGLDWTNLTSSTTLTITFASAVTGPVSFDIFDINVGSWGGNNPVFIDKITLTGTDCSGNIVYPTITAACGNNMSGANSNVITGSLNCTNTTNTVTFNAATIKTITLTYTSGTPLASGYGNDPDPQYIIVSDITAGGTGLINLNTTSPFITCSSSTATLSAGATIPGATYSWAGPNSLNPAGTTPANSSTDVSATGTYTVTVTDGGSCSASASVVVSQNTTAPDVSIATPALLGCTGSITLNASSNTAGITYNWGGGGTGNTKQVSSAGNYSVTVTNPANGCTASANTTVTAGAGITLNTLQSNTTCGNNNGAATVNIAVGTGPFTYMWNNTAITQSINSVPSGNYSVTVTGSGGCTASATANVAASTAVNVSVAVTDASCGNNNGAAIANVTSGTGPFNYVWNTSATTQNIGSLSAGTYIVTVTGSGGCADTVSAIINSTGSLTLSITAVNALCGGNTGSASVSALSGTAPYTFVWNNSSNNDTIVNLSAGNYAVTVSDATGCTATAVATISSDTATVNVTSDKTIMCANDTAQVCAPAGYSHYLWNTGDTTVCTKVTQAGGYYVTVTGNGNCTVTSNHVNVAVYQLPPVSISVNGDTLTAYNAVTYQWYLGGVLLPNDTAGVLIAPVSGSYSVAITDTNGCRAISNRVNVVATGLDNIISGDEIKIYPNPLVGGTLHLITGGSIKDGDVEIFDNRGQLVYKTDIHNSTINVELNIAKGIYVIRISSAVLSFTRKLIVL